MSYLVRKITISKWPDGVNSCFTNIKELRADAISDLRTQSDTLSWWYINDLDEIEEIGLAFISILPESTDKISLIAIPYEVLSQSFKLKNTPENGITALKNMKEKHYDICDLNYSDLGRIGSIIAKETIKNKNPLIHRIKVSKTIEKFKKLYSDGNLDYDSLGKYLKRKLL